MDKKLVNAIGVVAGLLGLGVLFKIWHNTKKEQDSLHEQANAVLKQHEEMQKTCKATWISFISPCRGFIFSFRWKYMRDYMIIFTDFEDYNIGMQIICNHPIVFSMVYVDDPIYKICFTTSESSIQAIISDRLVSTTTALVHTGIQNGLSSRVNSLKFPVGVLMEKATGIFSEV